jgi:hypothetical protein
MANEQIRINPSKPSTLEFDVAISGLDKVVPSVRFVLKNVYENVDWTVSCTKLSNNKWQAAFPTFKNFKLSQCKFWVEVMIDEFYFRPAEGIIEFVNTPDVSFTGKTTKKPSVTTSFSQKTTKKKITESSGGPEVTGQYAPTNGLLHPEENPEFTQSTVKVAKHDLNDQHIDQSKLEDITDTPPTPGTGHPYAEIEPEDFDIGDEDSDTDNNEVEYETHIAFDPSKVAEDILSTTIGSSTKPNTRGSLFKRDSDGKAIVPGLESDKQKQERYDKSQTVRDIIKH